MRHLVLAALLLALSWPVAAKPTGRGEASRASQPAAGGRPGGGGGRGQGMQERHVPPLDASRRVVEHDCTKPFDFKSGNLRCK